MIKLLYFFPLSFSLSFSLFLYLIEISYHTEGGGGIYNYSLSPHGYLHAHVNIGMASTSLSACQLRRRSKRCTNFMRGARSDKKEKRTSRMFEFKFRISTWRPRPRGNPQGRPWSAVGCSFRSRRPSIFEQDRPETDPVGHRRRLSPWRVYMYIHVYT